MIERRLPGLWYPFVVLIGAAAVGLVVAVTIPLPEGSFLSRARAKCDEAVKTMLTTDVPVELQRAMFLIERLDCAVQRRLP